MNKDITYKINDKITIKVGSIYELKAYAAMSMYYSVKVNITNRDNGTDTHILTLEQFTELSEIALEYWKEYLY